MSFDKFDLNRSDHPYTSLQAANPASSFEFEHSEISINHSKVKTISTNMICETRCRRTVLKTVVILCGAPCAIKLNFSHVVLNLIMMSAFDMTECME